MTINFTKTIQKTILGFPTELKIGPEVAASDLKRPNITNILKGSTTGLHSDPKSITIISSERTYIPTAAGIAKYPINLKT